MLDWIFWNITDYLYKMDLALNNLQRLMCHKTQTTNQSCQSFTSNFQVRLVVWHTKISFCRRSGVMANVSPRGVMANALDCSLDVDEFKLQLLCYVQFQNNVFGKGMNPLISPIYELNIITGILQQGWHLALNNPWRLIIHEAKEPMPSTQNILQKRKAL